jgi:hypothetical protein
MISGEPLRTVDRLTGQYLYITKAVIGCGNSSSGVGDERLPPL